MTVSKIFSSNKPYGVKVGGVWTLFNTKSEYRKFLKNWIACTTYADKSKAFTALNNLNRGIYITDTDLI